MKDDTDKNGEQNALMPQGFLNGVTGPSGPDKKSNNEKKKRPMDPDGKSPDLNEPDRRDQCSTPLLSICQIG